MPRSDGESRRRAIRQWTFLGIQSNNLVIWGNGLDFAVLRVLIEYTNHEKIRDMR